MLTINGCLDVAIIPRGFVRNASTAYLLSLLMNVNESTSANCFPLRTSEFRSVNFRGCGLPLLRKSCARSEGLENAYATELSLPGDQAPTEPRSLITTSGCPPVTGKR